MEFLEINLTKHSCLVRILKNTILYCEMVFLDIKIAKVSSLLLHAIYKKIRETRKLESFHVERENKCRKPNKKSSLRRLKFMPGNSTKNVVQEFHLKRSPLIFLFRERREKNFADERAELLNWLEATLCSSRK